LQIIARWTTIRTVVSRRSMVPITDDEIESRAVAMFRRAFRRARQMRGNFALRYEAQGTMHTVKLIETVLEQEAMK
jgi:hypothetical protein